MKRFPDLVLSTRELNRALLARQMLLRREERSAHDALTHLIGLQSQAPNPPFIGLWSRLAAFDPDELSRMMWDRTAVRIALLRSTIFVVTAEDALEIRPMLEPVIRRMTLANHGKFVEGVDLDDLAARARELVETRPHTFVEIGTALGERWPEVAATALGDVVRGLLPLAQVPPRGVWGQSGPAAHTTLDSWLRRPLATEPDLDRLIRRYLAAYGPATVQDIQGWCGLNGLGPVIQRLGPELLVVHDEQGRQLWDLPDAPRPPAETPAPVRLLPDFDVSLLSHRERSRIMAPELKNRVFTINGIIKASVLVDGFVAGIWKLVRDGQRVRLVVEGFIVPDADVVDELTGEAAALAQFVHPGTEFDGVEWTVTA